ncbi:MAG: AsmA family protein [bacterium]
MTGKLRRIIKIFLWIAAATLAAVILLVVASPLLIPRDEIRRIAVEQAERFINREVSIGRLSVNIFTGLELSDLSLSNMPREQDTGFSREPMIRVDKIILRYQLLPLLLRRVVVSKVEVIHPRILIENRNGKFNFSDILVDRSRSPEKSSPPDPHSEGDPPPPKRRASGGLNLWVSNLVVRDAEIVYKSIEERKPLRVIEARDLNLSLSDVNIYGNPPVELSIDTSLRGIPSMEAVRLSVKGKASVDLPQRAVDIIGLNLSLEGSEITIRGALRDWGNLPIVDLNVHSDNLFPPSLIQRIHLPGDLKLEGTGTVNVDMKGRPGDLSVRGFADATESDIEYRALIRKGRGTAARVDFDAHQSANGIAMRELALNLGGLSLLGSGELSNLSSGPDIEAELSTNEFPLNDLLDLLPPLKERFQLGGNIKLEAKALGNARRLKEFDFDGNLSLSNVSANFLPMKFPVEGLEGSVTFSSDSLDIPELRGNIDGSPTVLSARISDFKSPNIDFKFKTRELNVDKLLPLIPRRGTAKGPGASSQEKRAEAGPPSEGASPPSKGARDDILGRISGRAEVEVGKIRFKTAELSDFRLKAALDRKVATLSRLSGNLYDGDLNVWAKLDLGKGKPIYDLSVDLKNVDANSLLSNLTDLRDNVEGLFSLEVVARGRGLSAEEAKRSLTASGKFSLRDGHIKNLSWQNALASILDERRLRDIEFGSFGGDLSIDEGRIRSRKLELVGDKLRMEMDGTVSLSGEVDYRIDARFPKGSIRLPPALAPFLEILEKDGWLSLPLRVTGPLQQPVLSWDMEAIERVAKEKLAEGKEDAEARKKAKEIEKKVRENIERVGKSILDSILGR